MARTQQAGIVKSMTGATFNPDRLLSLPDERRDMLLGTIIGRANGVCTAMGRDDEVLQGLTGMFAFKDADDARGTFKSYQFWPMSGFMSDLFDAVTPEKDENGKVVRPAGQVDFAFEVYAIRAGNAAKRSWKVVPLFEPTEADPMAELAKRAGVALGGKSDAPAIEHKAEASDAPAADADAEKEPAKVDTGKGKGHK